MVFAGDVEVRSFPCGVRTNKVDESHRISWFWQREFPIRSRCSADAQKCKMFQQILNIIISTKNLRANGFRQIIPMIQDKRSERMQSMSSTQSIDVLICILIMHLTKKLIAETHEIAVKSRVCSNFCLWPYSVVVATALWQLGSDRTNVWLVFVIVTDQPIPLSTYVLN